MHLQNFLHIFSNYGSGIQMFTTTNTKTYLLLDMILSQFHLLSSYPISQDSS
jgi:hypothetical protein